MKQLLVILSLIFFTGASAQEANGDWLTDFDEAQRIADKESKPIFIYFTGSDWCKPCIQLKKDFFDTEVFKGKSEKIVLLYVDRPYRRDIITAEQMEKNKALIKKFNKSGKFPMMVVLNRRGKVIDEISGYSGNPKFYEAFINKNS